MDGYYRRSFAGLTLFKFGLVKNMVFGAIFVPLANLPFIYLNSVGYDIWALVITITIDNFSQGFIGVVGITFIQNGIQNLHSDSICASLWIGCDSAKTYFWRLWIFSRRFWISLFFCRLRFVGNSSHHFFFNGLQKKGNIRI